LDFCDSVIAGADGVAHLGAIPNPTDARQFEVFKNNSVSTFAVFTAAAKQKLKPLFMHQVFQHMALHILMNGLHHFMHQLMKPTHLSLKRVMRFRKKLMKDRP
jgi:hypothetical protein